MKKVKFQNGVVVSNNMEKSIVVLVETKYKHPLYKKTVKRSKKYVAHDENNECNIGDFVQIQRAGDVIPQVISVDKSKRDKKSKEYKFPEKCLCGSVTQ